MSFYQKYCPKSVVIDGESSFSTVCSELIVLFFNLIFLKVLNLSSFADGMYMMEVDRVLRPGGYWVISGPPINWRDNYQAWQRPKEEFEGQQRKIEELAKFLCWEKKYENGEIAIWKKRTNYDSCRDQHQLPTSCNPSYSDDLWYLLHLLTPS